MITEISEEKVKSSEYKPGVYPKGCEYCVKGEKVTFYITFKCDYKCFYCSVPSEFKNTEKMMVGNIPVKDIDEAFEHIKKYKCVAISGGEPLIYVDKVLDVIKRAKKNNIYTYLFTDGSDSGRLTPSLLKKLVDAGLGEIKMSTKLKGERTLLFDPYKMVKDSPISIHAEFPMLPNLVNEVYDFAIKLSDIGVSHFLLDQAEFSTSNVRELLKRGFKKKDGVVVGSEEAAFEVIERARKNKLDINILYCKALNPKHQYKEVGESRDVSDFFIKID